MLSERKASEHATDGGVFSAGKIVSNFSSSSCFHQRTLLPLATGTLPGQNARLETGRYGYCETIPLEPLYSVGGGVFDVLSVLWYYIIEDKTRTPEVDRKALRLSLDYNRENRWWHLLVQAPPC